MREESRTLVRQNARGAARARKDWRSPPGPIAPASHSRELGRPILSPRHRLQPRRTIIHQRPTTGSRRSTARYLPNPLYRIIAADRLQRSIQGINSASPTRYAHPASSRN
ncbi:hypothetical protein R1flu_011046 [Riccia fluitans]|uniref:Uncharacterized protein n=1 Tax=Riccia fluitans TaxID=41844 RepID=A0ABD1Z977_9MARC